MSYTVTSTFQFCGPKCATPHPRHVLHFPLCFCGSIITHTATANETVSISLPRDRAAFATTIETLIQCQYLDK